jgi:hypothetical protein
MNDDGFTYGPFGEILPPPLVAGVDPEEAREQAGLVSLPSVERVPQPGLSRAERDGLAAMALQQVRLAEALGGRLATAEGRALYRAVAQQGKMLSLRPLGMEGESYRTFAPVLQRISRDRWRVGTRGHGRVQELFAADPAQALDKARELYVRWAEEEATAALSRPAPTAGGGPRAAALLEDGSSETSSSPALSGTKGSVETLAEDSLEDSPARQGRGKP